MKKIILPLIVGFLLAGCSSMVTIPRESKNALRYAPDVIVESKNFHGNYQYLAKCWDERAEKQKVDFSNATYMKIYSELELAEIVVQWDGFGDTGFGVLIEIKKTNPTESIVNAYGMGAIGHKKIPEWLSILESCGNSQ